MRNTVVIGGGPGGLYFAILSRLADPSAAVQVIERNSPTHETFGFGVAFHEATLRKLAEADPVSRDALDTLLRPWDDVAFHVRGAQFRLPGHAFAGCSRARLIDLLRGRAEELGASVQFGRATTVGEHPEADLVVVADGSSSPNRALLADVLHPVVTPRPVRFVWLGTTKRMAEMNFFFREATGGMFVAHAYPHDAEYGTWIVEADEQAFQGAGLDTADEAQTVRVLESVFAEDLGGARLIARDSFWRRFPWIECARWTTDNVALIGDAKATVHYSIGSGTKLAMEDAVALAGALAATPSVPDALARYEATRRPEVDLLQTRALGSMHWFESVREHWSLDPAQFTFSGVTRKTDETFQSVDARAPQLARAALHACSPSGAPLAEPFTLAERTLPGRQVTVTPGPPITGWSGQLSEVAGVVLAEGVDAYAPVRAVLPAEHPLGVRVHAVQDPQPLLAQLHNAAAAGCVLVSVRAGGPGTPGPAYVADLVRQQLGLPTLCEDLANEDAAVTALVAGRADLVSFGTASGDH